MEAVKAELEDLLLGEEEELVEEDLEASENVFTLDGVEYDMDFLTGILTEGFITQYEEAGEVVTLGIAYDPEMTFGMIYEYSESNIFLTTGLLTVELPAEGEFPISITLTDEFTDVETVLMLEGEDEAAETATFRVDSKPKKFATRPPKQMMRGVNTVAGRHGGVRACLKNQSN